MDRSPAAPPAPAACPLRRRVSAFWDLAVAAVATAAAVYVPLAVLPGFVEPSAAVEWGLTAVFGLDAVVQARRLREAPRRGARRTLVATGLAAVPAFLVGVQALWLLRLLALARVADAVRTLGRRDAGSASRLRLATLAYGLALTVHLVTCGFVRLGGVPPGPDADRYLGAAYWSVSTLTTVGYGDVLPQTPLQKLYAIGVMLLGVGVYATLIGNVASLVSRADPLRAAHAQQRERRDAFMRYRALPVPLRRRVQAYHDYLWDRGLAGSEAEVLGDLPPGLRDEVALALRRDLVRGVPLFEGASDAFRRDVTLQMRPIAALAGDTLVRAGESGREMYVLSRGAAEVLGPDGEVLRTLTAGDVFGELALLHDAPRTATVRALVTSDLYVLERDAYERVARAHPELAVALRRRAGAYRDGGA